MQAPLILNQAVIPMPRNRRTRKKEVEPVAPPVPVVVEVIPKKSENFTITYPKQFTVPNPFYKPTLTAASLDMGKRLFQKVVEKVQEPPRIKFGAIPNNMVTFRVIPHANVTNNNKRLWRMIHKMYEMYEPLGTRREKWHDTTYREKDFMWYDIVFRQVKGQKRIEFYISTSEYQADKLKRKIENKMDVTITEATIEDMQVPTENTIVQEIKYLKHDIFSLNTNTNDVKTPISAILNTIDELQFDGDFARLSICNEVENRKKWVKSAGYAYEKMQNGKVPQRAVIDGNKVAGMLKVGIAGFVNEVNDLLTDTFQALQNSFIKSDKDFKKEKVVKKAFSLEDEISSKRINGNTASKINTPVFRSHIRVAAHSKDRLTRETMSETLVGSLAELAEDNEFAGYACIGSRRSEIIQEMNTLRLTVRTKYDPNVNLVSTDEMSKLALHMPDKELQRRYASELDTKRKVETDIPAVMRKDGIYLGEAEQKDAKIPIYMPITNPDELYRGYVFIGGQGAGKDTAIKNWVIDACMKFGISSIVIDAIMESGARGMADGIRDSLPPEKVIDLDLSNEDYIIPLDLTEVVKKLGRLGPSRFADEMVDFLGVSELTQAKHILKVVAKAANGSLFNIKQIIMKEKVRLQRIKELQAEGNNKLADDLIELGTNDQIGSKADPILNRIGDYLDSDVLEPIFSQPPKPELDFEAWMSEGKVIIVRIPNRKFGKLATRTLVHWVTIKAFMTRLLMEKAGQENGCFVVFNEPEQYLSDSLVEYMGRIATEGRKERFGSLYAFHHWNKLPTSLQENMQGGGVQQFLFMNDHTRTFDLSRHRFEDTIPIEEAYKVPAHHAIVSVRAGGELQNAFICHMRPPKPKTEMFNNSFLTKRHARMYGRSYKQLQAAE